MGLEKVYYLPESEADNIDLASTGGKMTFFIWGKKMERKFVVTW